MAAIGLKFLKFSAIFSNDLKCTLYDLTEKIERNYLRTPKVISAQEVDLCTAKRLFSSNHKVQNIELGSLTNLKKHFKFH